MRTREKKTFHTVTKIGETYYPLRPSVPPSPYNAGFNGVECLSSVCLDETAPGPPYKWVNPLSIQHRYNPLQLNCQESGEHWLSGTGIWELRYRGRYWTSLGIALPAFYSDASSYNSMNLDALGATGWKKFKPAKPLADVGVMLGESREIPRMLKDSVKALKQLAFNPTKTIRNMSWLSNQNLAMQFGWLPLMRDLEKCYDAYQKANDELARIRKENGQWVHHGGTVATGGGCVQLGTCSITPGPTGYSLPPEGTTQGPVYVSWGYRVWFSAWFKYYIEDFDAPLTRFRLGTRIWGLNNTPTIVWNLLPWSWLVDWFSNLGDNIDNLVPIDGLVARMPCIMRHCWTRYDGEVRQRFKEPNGSFVTHQASNFKLIETKGRAVASPFGFGLSGKDLSARQLSILASLGVKYS